MPTTPTAWKRPDFPTFSDSPQTEALLRQFTAAAFQGILANPEWVETLNRKCPDIPGNELINQACQIALRHAIQMTNMYEGVVVGWVQPRKEGV